MSDIGSVRSEIVARLKREIQEKTYRVKSTEIADKITQKMRENEKFVAPFKKNKWTA